MQEFSLTVQRQISGSQLMSRFENDPNLEHLALRRIALPSILEEVMVMQRRMMLGAMHDPVAAAVAIVVNGLEEAIVRCTMVYRDELWAWASGRPELNEAELRATRLVQAASAANGMRIEVTCIITSR